MGIADVQLSPLLVQTDAGGLGWLMIHLEFNMLTSNYNREEELLYLQRSQQFSLNVNNLELVTGAVDHNHVAEVITHQGLQLLELHPGGVVEGVGDHGGLVPTDDVDKVEARICNTIS